MNFEATYHNKNDAVRLTRAGVYLPCSPLEFRLELGKSVNGVHSNCGGQHVIHILAR